MLGDQISHLDQLFLSIESPSTPMHTAGVVIFDGKLDFQRVFETIDSRLHLVPRFTQRLVEVPFGVGRPFWSGDPGFDLSYHLRHAALPAPGADEQLCDYAARLISRPLDRSKPLWEIYVIEGLLDDRSAMVTKTHHAMIDGLSTMDLATVLLDFGPEPEVTKKVKVDRPDRLPGAPELLSEAVLRQAKELTDLPSAVQMALSGPRRLAQKATGVAGALTDAAVSALKPAQSSPLNVGPGLNRRFAIVRSTLQTFKDIKDAAGATVNDVLLCVCADALGRLLRSRGEPTEARSLKTLVPVSVRGPGAGLGNEITGVFPDLPIGKMAPLDRLDAVRRQMDGIKESKKAAGADLLVNFTRWAPPTLHTMAARLGSRARIMNLVISNVPGPQMPLYSCGVKMLEPYAVIPLSKGQSLAIGVTSYDGGIFFGLNASREAHPDLQQLARYLDESIADMGKAAAEGSGAKITTAETRTAVGRPVG